MSTETYLPSSESLKEIETNDSDLTSEPIQEASHEEILFWDLRPSGVTGHLISAGGRELARIKNMEDAGAVVWLDEKLEGSGVVITHRPGMIIESHVIACAPIPANEMAPHQKDIDGVVTPLWSIGKSDWIRDASKLPKEE